MDLFLMDSILKGHIPEKGRVLDVGCGEGRNGAYFINQGYEYCGVDKDASKIRLLEYLSKNTKSAEVTFLKGAIEELDFGSAYDVIIASRVLHFLESEHDFKSVWEKLKSCLKPGGVVYFAMDSAISKSFVKEREKGMYEFPDGRISFSLTELLYKYMLEGFQELEDRKTILYRNKRAQSFGLLRRV